MENRCSLALTSWLQKLHINPKGDGEEEDKSNSKNTPQTNKLRPEKITYQREFIACRKNKCPSLVSVCIGILGKHLEDIIDDLREVTATFPLHSKMAMMAIARRRKLLNDEVLVSLADSSWDVIDISESDVSDVGLTEVGKTCGSIRALDISRCSRITAQGLSELLKNCHSLEILRCGGCFRSDAAIRRCLSILKPNLNDVAGDSWEELDSNEIANAAESLRWLLWPNIDDDSRDTLVTECPRIVVNPDPSPFGLVQVPREAIGDIALDEPFVMDINPNTWAVSGVAPRAVSLADSRVVSSGDSTELHIAERFRLAYVERDVRLTPKRAKNARQHKRRAEREWVMTSAEAKSVVLASKLNKSINSRT